MMIKNIVADRPLW